MEEPKSVEHVEELVTEVITRIPEEDKEFFQNTLVNFHMSESKSNWNTLNITNTLGFARPIDRQKMEKFEVGLNYFQAKILSDKAIKGAVAHELGHVKDEYRKGWRRRWQDRLEKWLIHTEKINRDRGWSMFDSETRANNYAREMGFEQEIEALEAERHMIPPELEVNSNDDLGRDNLSLNVSMSCGECDKGFTGSYYYLPHHPAEKSSLVVRYAEVPIHKISSKNGVEPETMISEAKCPDCRSQDAYQIESVEEAKV